MKAEVVHRRLAALGLVATLFLLIGAGRAHRQERAVAATSPFAPGASRPNIVVILADDLGYGDVGAYNPQSKIATPNLDRLAREGIRLTDGHAAASVCTPSRYGLLTGRYCWRTGIRDAVLNPFDPALIEKGRMTLPALLKRKGYRTAAFGKWHLGMDWATTDGAKPNNRANGGLSNVDFSRPIAEGPTTRGFDSFFGVDVANYPPYAFIENDRVVGRPSVAMPDTLLSGPQPPHWGPVDIRRGPMLPGWDFTALLPTVTDHAARYIDEATAQADKPFFLYLALTAPHVPIAPAKAYWGKSGAGPYGDFVQETDDCIGHVLDALDRSGAANDTLVVFTSDNGPDRMAYPRIRLSKHYSMGDWRGIKRDGWEGGHRVPFLVRWPGHVKPNTTTDEIISQVDLMATLAAVIGATVPKGAGEDSVNVLPALLDLPHKTPLRAATVEHEGGTGAFSLRVGDWLYLDAPTGAVFTEPAWYRAERHYGVDTTPALLYNLHDDPQERHNLYAENPAKVRKMQALLAHIKAEGMHHVSATSNTPSSQREESDPE